MNDLITSLGQGAQFFAHKAWEYTQKDNPGLASWNQRHADLLSEAMNALSEKTPKEYRTLSRYSFETHQLDKQRRTLTRFPRDPVPAPVVVVLASSAEEAQERALTSLPEPVYEDFEWVLTLTSIEDARIQRLES